MLKIKGIYLLFCLGLFIQCINAQTRKHFSDHLIFKGVAVEEPGYFLWGASPIEDEK